MFKILVVRSSGGDYGACTFKAEIPKSDWPKIWDEAAGKKYVEKEVGEDVLEIKAYGFDERPDQKFLDLMRNLQDYDDSKHRDWFEVECE